MCEVVPNRGAPLVPVGRAVNIAPQPLAQGPHERFKGVKSEQLVLAQRSCARMVATVGIGTASKMASSCSICRSESLKRTAKLWYGSSSSYADSTPSIMMSGMHPAVAASYTRVEKPKPAAAMQNLEVDISSKYLSRLASWPSRTRMRPVELALKEGERWVRNCLAPRVVEQPQWHPRVEHGGTDNIVTGLVASSLRGLRTKHVDEHTRSEGGELRPDPPCALIVPKHPEVVSSLLAIKVRPRGSQVRKQRRVHAHPSGKQVTEPPIQLPHSRGNMDGY
eukprot:scaffold33573_cov33-Tisochrysis_lutea.AAC.2